MELVIPSKFTHKGRVVNIGKEPIILDASDRVPAEEFEGYSSLYDKNFLFRAMIKFVLAPNNVLARRNYNIYDDNLHFFLDVGFLREVSMDNDYFKVDDNVGFDEEEYKIHIKYAHEQLIEMATEDFLDLIIDKDLIKTDKEATLVASIKRYMTQEGKDEPLKNLKDDEGRIGSRGQDRILGYAIKSMKTKQLWNVANAINPKDRIYKHMLDDSKLHDYVTYKFNMLSGAEAREYPYREAIQILVDFDTHGYFKAEMDEQGIDMPSQPYKEGEHHIRETEIAEPETDAESLAMGLEDTSSERASIDEYEEQSAETDEEAKMLKSLQKISKILSDIIKAEPQSTVKDDVVIVLNGETMKLSEVKNAIDREEIEEEFFPFIPTEYDVWEEWEQDLWHRIIMKWAWNNTMTQSGEKGEEGDISEDFIKTMLYHEIAKIKDWEAFRAKRDFSKRGYNHKEKSLLIPYLKKKEEEIKHYVSEGGQEPELHLFHSKPGINHPESNRPWALDIESIEAKEDLIEQTQIYFDNQQLIHSNDDSGMTIFSNDIKINRDNEGEPHITNASKNKFKIDFKKLYTKKGPIKEELDKALNPIWGGNFHMEIIGIIGSDKMREAGIKFEESDELVPTMGKNHKKFSDRWNDFYIAAHNFKHEVEWPYRGYLLEGGGKTGRAFKPPGWQKLGVTRHKTQRKTRPQIIGPDVTRREKIQRKDKEGVKEVDEMGEPLWEMETLTPQQHLQEGGGPGKSTKATITFILYVKGQIEELKGMVSNA